jgi:dipeptidyl aminopeptidase/acylaminoacyl peptidase
MRYSVCAAFALFAFCALTAGPYAQSRPSSEFLPVPENVKADGVPSIPASSVSTLAPYAGFRRALFAAWHPTRREILLSTTFGNVPQFHSVAGPGMDRQQITFFPEGLSATTSASYAPDGSFLLISRDAPNTPAAEATQFYRYDVPTRQSTLLTDGKSRYLSYAWSNHGAQLAFDSTQRNGRDRDLYVMNPGDPSSVRRIAELQGGWTIAEWSPDDRQLLVINVPAGASRTFLWLVDVKTGVKRPLTPADEEILWRTPQFSPDGRYVYALANKDSELSRVWRCDLASDEWKPLGDPEEMIDNASLSPDGRTFAVVVFTPSGSRLELRDARTLAVRSTPKLPNGLIIGRPSWRPDSSEIAFSFWSPSMFGDVFSVRVGTGAVERWTRSESGVFNPETLPEPELVKWKSFDGLEFSGVLYRPPAKFTGPRPVIISIHGGPSGTAAIERPRFQGRSNYFLNELGIAIIYPNVRGSYGFGKSFGRLDDQLKREDSVKDVGAVLDWIGSQGAFDKQRVMVTGISYGGYMSYAVAEMFPDRVRCAVSANGIADFITYFQYTNESRVEDRRAEYGDERDPAMRDFLAGISPVTHASKLKAPLLIVNGARDPRVPPQQGDEMAKAVKADGTPVWHIVFADEPHVLFASSVPNNNYFFYVQIQFIRQYLLN